MCKCTPNMRTPFCGKPGCEWPKSILVLSPAEVERVAKPEGLVEGRDYIVRKELPTK